MGATIPNVLQRGAFVWFEKTHGSLVKVLTVSEWRPMKQLAVRVHFLRCDALLDDWSVECVLSLVFIGREGREDGMRVGLKSTTSSNFGTANITLNPTAHICSSDIIP
ncbi:e3 ubiquitin-protein ligase RNF13 [Trichonephila clavipes]|nr:e3 ubiquitin-protein ligase RNF13 [Trichonephila clavipes]